MGSSRALTDDGDLLYADGKQVMVEGRDAIAQGIGICLTLIQGDDPFFPRLGLNLERITGSSEDDRVAELFAGIDRSGRARRVLSVEKPVEADRARQHEYIVRLTDRTDREVTLGITLGA